MKQKRASDFENFDKVISGLLAVPYAELQQKLEEEKRAKAKHNKKRATSPPSSRASSNQKKPIA